MSSDYGTENSDLIGNCWARSLQAEVQDSCIAGVDAESFFEALHRLCWSLVAGKPQYARLSPCQDLPATGRMAKKRGHLCMGAAQLGIRRPLTDAHLAAISRDQGRNLHLRHRGLRMSPKLPNVLTA